MTKVVFRKREVLPDARGKWLLSWRLFRLQVADPIISDKPVSGWVEDDEVTFEVDATPDGNATGLMLQQGGSSHEWWFVIPDVVEVTVAELVADHQVDPETLVPLDPVPPSVQDVLDEAVQAKTVAVGAAEAAEAAASAAAEAKDELVGQKGQPEGIAALDADGDVVTAAGEKVLTPTQANLAYLTPDIAVERSATGAVVAIEQNGEPTTYARDATGAIIAYTRGGITHTITRTATGAIEGISA